MTLTLHAKQRLIVDEMVARLRAAVGDTLKAAVLFGTATQGEHAEDGELALLLVLADLELTTLSRVREPLAFWRKKGLPVPRMFTAALLDSSRDVFPIELMDLTVHREILLGEDPLVGMKVDDEHLRIQCEREITERLMRLREAYAHDGGDRALRRLLVESFPAFTQVMRGALRLVGRSVPHRGAEVARDFAVAAGLDPAPFAEVAALRDGHAPSGSDAIARLFSRYYQGLERSAEFIDRHVVASADMSQQGAAS